MRKLILTLIFLVPASFYLGCGSENTTAAKSNSTASDGVTGSTSTTSSATAGTTATDATDGATTATDATDGTTTATDGTTAATDATDGTTAATDATDGATAATDATDGATTATDATDATDGTDSTLPPGECTNETDLAKMQPADTFKATTTKCATDTIAFGDFKKCLIDATGISNGCASCFDDLIECTKEKCLWAGCINPDSQDCQNCLKDNCYDAFEKCSGVPPQ